MTIGLSNLDDILFVAIPQVERPDGAWTLQQLPEEPFKAETGGKVEQRREFFLA